MVEQGRREGGRCVRADIKSGMGARAVVAARARWRSLAAALGLMAVIAGAAACSEGGGPARMPWDAPAPAPTATKSGTAGSGGAGSGMVGAKAVVPGIVGEPDVRVRMVTASARVRVATTGAVRAVWVSPRGSTRPAARLATPVVARLDERGWELSDASGLVAKFERSAEVRLAATESELAAPIPGSPVGKPATGTAAASGAMLLLEGRAMPGWLVLVARSDVSASVFDVIEHVGVEQYLTGVVAAEMLPGWPQAAFEAQAVAARSYALHERGRARAAGKAFDLESSVADQAYNGLTDNVVAARAVMSTRGAVLTWQGQLLRAYYSSTSGGRAASAKDTWPTVAGFEFNLQGPLQAQVRPELGRTSPWYRWSVNRTRQELTDRLREWGRINGHAVRAITSLESARVTATNVTGRPTTFEVRGGGRAYTLTAEELRRACNQSVNGHPAIVRANRVHSGDMEWSTLGDVVTIRGRGFGHGVGLCQYSAKELADRGAGWASILMQFYPGARIDRAY